MSDEFCSFFGRNVDKVNCLKIVWPLAAQLAVSLHAALSGRIFGYQQSKKVFFSRGTGFVSSANGHPSELGHGEERWRDAEIHVLFLSYYLQVRVDELSYRWLLSLHTDLKACGCVCLWFSPVFSCFVP